MRIKWFLLGTATDGDFGDGGGAVGGEHLEADIACGVGGEGGGFHSAVGRPGSGGDLGEARAVGAGQDPVGGDVAVLAALLLAVVRHDAEPADVGLHAAEIQRDRLRQRAGGLPHADEVGVVLAVDRGVRVAARRRGGLRRVRAVVLRGLRRAGEGAPRSASTPRPRRAAARRSRRPSFRRGWAGS